MQPSVFSSVLPVICFLSFLRSVNINPPVALADSSGLFGAQSSQTLLSSFFNLFSREQDEDLDDLSATVERLGDVGLSIHEELAVQVQLSSFEIAGYCPLLKSCCLSVFPQVQIFPRCKTPPLVVLRI